MTNCFGIRIAERLKYCLVILLGLTADFELRIMQSFPNTDRDIADLRGVGAYISWRR